MVSSKEYMNKNKLCVMPWMNLEINPKGIASPCCRYINNNFFIENKSLDEVWNSNFFVELREQFLKNGMPSNNCSLCIREEESGIDSLRTYKNDDVLVERPEMNYESFFNNKNPYSPKTLDLKLSNLCNLKCRICSPYCSSKWIKEAKDSNLFQDQFNLQGEVAGKDIFDERNLKILDKWSHSLDKIDFFGGEPLLIDTHWKIINLLIDNGTSINIGLVYNTNGTQYKNEFIDKWKNFKYVNLHISIDDIEDRFTYQRHPANWSVVQDNFFKFKEEIEKYKLKGKGTCRPYCTVNILNIYYLPEYITWLENNSIYNCVFNLVHNPAYYSIQNIPDNIKKEISNKINNFIEKKNSSYNETLKDYLNFMNDNQVKLEKWDKFLIETSRADLYRKENFKNTFSDFYEIIKREGYQIN